MITEGRNRVIIQDLTPCIDGGRFPVKRVVGEKVVVMADILCDGHDLPKAVILYKKDGEERWSEAPMRPLGNDRWRGEFTVGEMGRYIYTAMGWVDHFLTWQTDIRKKLDAGQDIRVDILICLDYLEKAAGNASGGDRKRLEGLVYRLKNKELNDETLSFATSRELAELMDRHLERTFVTTFAPELSAVVDPAKALFSSWYEFFPRSRFDGEFDHGTFKECEDVLKEVAEMGFDVVYLPPIHPIGTTKRKGKNNTTKSEPGDVGSPWAIGSDEGGHTSIHPLLGTEDDFKRLVKKAKGYGIDIAVDIAFQCSPDHPYVSDHPEWFRWRPDGTVQYAENPPKKYEDVLPLNFETDDWKSMWDELKSVITFWIEQGVRIFRVDNPHTKPFSFWEWVIREIKAEWPDTIFLSEAFTRPKVMYYLAKLGFTQSYTYFTWRNTKVELSDYVTELTKSEIRDFFRPNFWTNTPDILPEHLQYGGRPVFITRLVLAATLSSSYGLYGPTFELCVSEAVPGKEEYLDSEKYEIKSWDWDSPGNLKEVIKKVNRIRKDNPALHSPWDIEFYDIDNSKLIAYGKGNEDLSNIILVVVNLDPFHKQSGWVSVPLRKLGIPDGQSYLVHDLLSDERYIWEGERNYVELDPHRLPAHIFRIRKRLKRENDFDYFM